MTTQRIVWHLGFQKTGTSSIQQMLIQNAMLFEPHAVLFPRHRSTRELRQAADAYTRSATKKAEFRLLEALGNITDRIKKNAPRTAIVSDETVLGQRLYSSSGHIFNWAASIIPMIRRVADGFENCFVFYTREIESWLVSAYSQAVKRLRLAEDYHDWRSSVPFELDWSVHMKSLEKLAGENVLFVSMEKEAAQGSIYGRALLEAAGLPESVITAAVVPERQNVKIPMGAEQFLLALNKSQLAMPEVKKVRRIVQANPHFFSSKG